MPRSKQHDDAIDQLERVEPVPDDDPAASSTAAVPEAEAGPEPEHHTEPGPEDDDGVDDAAGADVRPRIVPRDASWFTALVRVHERDVHRYLVRRAGQDAEDLTADVLTIAWRRREDVPEGAELPWLYRTAGFVLANHRRKGRPVPVERLPEVVDEDDPALRAVTDERVRGALAALSPRDRQIVLLNAWEGLTGVALAEALGVSRRGADAALSRARARLAAVWADTTD